MKYILRQSGDGKYSVTKLFRGVHFHPDTDLDAAQSTFKICVCATTVFGLLGIACFLLGIPGEEAAVWEVVLEAFYICGLVASLSGYVFIFSSLMRDAKKDSANLSSERDPAYPCSTSNIFKDYSKALVYKTQLEGE